jgi:acyl-CoA reductase-like NAD-dependent aldehyde dehydrogenase
VAREETFGPVAALFRFETEAEVIAAANDTEFGLASYFFTRDLGRAFRVGEALDYGMVGINTGLISTAKPPSAASRPPASAEKAPATDSMTTWTSNTSASKANEGGLPPLARV